MRRDNDAQGARATASAPDKNSASQERISGGSRLKPAGDVTPNYLSTLKSHELSKRVDWDWVLPALGVSLRFLQNRHGPCPGCGGKDRFRFDNKEGRGTWICSGGGALSGGNGFDLLIHVHRWSFSRARKEVLALVSSTIVSAAPRTTPTKKAPVEKSQAPILRLLAESVAISDCAEVARYFLLRMLPVPAKNSPLRAHPALPYWEAGKRIGTFAALLAPVVSVDGSLVTLQATYIENGKKIQDRPARKFMSGLAGKSGCAVRLAPCGATLGIAEGIETALAAQEIYGVPVWAALSSQMLALFIPPAGVDHLVIFADNDTAGVTAANQQMEGSTTRCTLRIPPVQGEDWADVLINREPHG